MASDSTSLLSIGKNRCRTEIVATIIALAQNGKCETEIMEEAGLNFKQWKRYLEELTRLDLVKVKQVDGRSVCVTSQGGKRFLKQYNRLREFLA